MTMRITPISAAMTEPHGFSLTGALRVARAWLGLSVGAASREAA
jgi:hypothetical protein